MRGDLTSRADIEKLVDTFYTHVRADEWLGPIFGDVAHVDWSMHLPRMYAFWEAVLFSGGGFKGNPLAVHEALNQMRPLEAREFDRWVSLFHATVDALFTGAVADDAKQRASRIALVMQFHLGIIRSPLAFAR